jgi:hypothetical protein
LGKNIDIVGLLPVIENGTKYILTCQGNLSNFIAIPLQNQSAEEVASVFVRNIILI